MVRDLIALFGAGVASFLAPCIVPLLPAYLGVLASAGSSAGSAASPGAGRTAPGSGPDRPVGATVGFVAGFAMVFAALGAVAGLAGSALDTTQGAVQRVGGAVVVVMGLSLLGALRGPFARERRLLPPVPTVAGRSRPFVIGVAFGAAWSPCVGPLLGAALTAAAASGEVAKGTALLVAYALGLGVPFVLAALGLASSPRAADRLRRAAPTVEKVGGVLLIVLGVLLLTGGYVHLTSYLARFTPALGGV